MAAPGRDHYCPFWSPVAARRAWAAPQSSRSCRRWGRPDRPCPLFQRRCRRGQPRWGWASSWVPGYRRGCSAWPRAGRGLDCPSCPCRRRPCRCCPCFRRPCPCRSCRPVAGQNLPRISRSFRSGTASPAPIGRLPSAARLRPLIPDFVGRFYSCYSSPYSSPPVPPPRPGSWGCFARANPASRLRPSSGQNLTPVTSFLR
jgi:hypothetical protein